MKTIALLIQTDDEKADLRRVAQVLAEHVDLVIEKTDLLNSWRTTFPMVASKDLIGTMREPLRTLDKMNAREQIEAAFRKQS